ncbi:MAG: TIGR03790 family protein [bacterium]|nr:TIGR03790 family protein [bacterium]
MSDETIKPIAERQLMALQREIYGLKGLIEYTKEVQTVKPPDVKLLTKMLEKAENTLVRMGRTGTQNSITNAHVRIKLLKLTGGLRLVAGYTPVGSKSSGKPQRKVNKLLTKTTASLDSELALLWKGNYKTEGSLTNPLHWKIRKIAPERGKGKTLMTARIDAPSVALSRRIITDSIATEKVGLKGVLYIDSGLTPRFAKAKNNAGYRAYDARLKALHSFVTKNTRMKVVLDTSSGLFAPGKCPDAALYAGWYSLRRYIPAFTWNRGAVGWHTASFEAADLRNPKSRQWCPQMLTNGVAATSGAVDEPLLMAFPAPEEFYPLLMTGKYTLAECYWLTTPRVSWQMTLIADPLYNPFKANPQVSINDLPPGLAP